MLRLYAALRKISLSQPCRQLSMLCVAKKSARSSWVKPVRIVYFREYVKQRYRAHDEVWRDFRRDSGEFSGQDGRQPAHLLLSLWQKTLRTELLVVPERSRSCQSVATKPGVTARAAFPAALAVPLRISSGEHFRFRLITRDRGRGTTNKLLSQQCHTPCACPCTRVPRNTVRAVKPA